MKNETPKLVLQPRQIQRYGWIPDLPDQRDHLFSLAAPTTLPEKVDLRECNPACLPPVYDQAELGSCTANAIAAAFEYDQAKQGAEAFLPSRLFIYYNERVIEGTVKQDAGAMIRDGMKSIAKQGVCKEDDWPYRIGNFKKKPFPKCYSFGLNHQSIAYKRVIGLQQIKLALASGFPVVGGFTVYDSFDNVGNTGIVPIPATTESVLGGHAILIVGYDNEENELIVRNSWGPNWGDRGYCYFPYEYQFSDCWTLTSVEQ